MILMVPVWGNITSYAKSENSLDIWRIRIEILDSLQYLESLKVWSIHFCILESHACLKLLLNVPVKMMEHWNLSLDPRTILCSVQFSSVAQSCLTLCDIKTIFCHSCDMHWTFKRTFHINQGKIAHCLFGTLLRIHHYFGKVLPSTILSWLNHQ